jgi:mRNA interferase MazF
MKKGDIVLIPFPFTDMSGYKLRPVLVLINSFLDVTVCFITSQLQSRDNFDVIVEPSEWTGIKRNSLIRISKMATLDKDLVVGRLGTLAPDEIKLVNKYLIRAFSLES